MSYDCWEEPGTGAQDHPRPGPCPKVVQIALVFQDLDVVSVDRLFVVILVFLVVIIPRPCRGGVARPGRFQFDDGEGDVGGGRGSRELGRLVPLRGRDDLFEAGLDFLEIPQLLAGTRITRACVGGGGRGSRGHSVRRRSSEQLRMIGQTGPRDGRPPRTHEVVVAELATHRAERMASLVRPLTSSRRSAWKTSQLATRAALQQTDSETHPVRWLTTAAMLYDPLAAYRLLPTAYCLLPASYCLLPAAYCLPRPAPLRLLDPDVDRDPLDLGDGGGHLEDLAVRYGPVGLEDHLAAVLPDAIGDGLAGLVERDPGPFPVTQEEPRLGPLALGLQERQERGLGFLHSHTVPRGGHVHLLAPAHLHGEEHESHELEDDVDHGRHVDVLVAFLGRFAAKEHGV